MLKYIAYLQIKVQDLYILDILWCLNLSHFEGKYNPNVFISALAVFATVTPTVSKQPFVTKDYRQYLTSINVEEVYVPPHTHEFRGDFSSGIVHPLGALCAPE